MKVSHVGGGLIVGSFQFVNSVDVNITISSGHRNDEKNKGDRLERESKEGGPGGGLLKVTCSACGDSLTNAKLTSRLTKGPRSLSPL